MLKTQLMEALIEHRDEVKKVLPTRFHVRVISFVKTKSYVSCNAVGERFRISPQSARIHLKTLCDKGYLKRVVVGKESRGRKHIYSYAL